MSPEKIPFFSDETTRAALAGALGGLVRWLTLRENWKEGGVSITVGAICAVYLGPLALPAVDPLLNNLISDTRAIEGFTTFMVGIGGIGVVGFVLDFWKARRGGGKDKNGGSPK